MPSLLSPTPPLALTSNSRAPFWKRWLRSQIAAPIGSSMVIARRYHFGAGGIAYAVTTLVLIVGAVNGQNNLLFVVFGAAVAGMLLSGIVSGWSMMGLRLTREAPGTMRVGERGYLRYVIENKSRLMPACGLLIEELDKATSAVGFAFEATSEKGLGKSRSSLARVPAQGKEIAITTVLPRRRGKYTLLAARIGSAFPIGLTRKSVTFVQQDAVLVWPARVHVPLGTAASAPTGDERGSGAPTRAGAEFFALREYQEGDNPRAIAWRASARSGAPVVRTYITPPGARTWIVLDLASAAGASDVFTAQEELIALAAGAAEQLLSQGHEIGLRATSGEAIVPLCRGIASISGVMDTLALLDAARLTSAAQSTSKSQASSAHMPRGSVLWICRAQPTSTVPPFSHLLHSESAGARAALQKHPAVLTSEDARAGALGIPIGFFDAFSSEVRSWVRSLFISAQPAQAGSASSKSGGNA